MCTRTRDACSTRATPGRGPKPSAVRLKQGRFRTPFVPLHCKATTNRSTAGETSGSAQTPFRASCASRKELALRAFFRPSAPVGTAIIYRLGKDVRFGLVPRTNLPVRG